MAEYETASWTGENESGIEPVSNKVVVKPDSAAAIVRGIHMTPDIIERHTMAAEAGVIVAVGAGAFHLNSDGSIFVGKQPKVGDRVFIERYGGRPMLGKDKVVYRVMDDSSIGAILWTEK